MTEQHASTEQLLDIKDGFTTEMCEHVASCLICQQELEALTEFGQSLGLALLDSAPPAQAGSYERVWQRVEKSIELENGEPLSNELMNNGTIRPNSANHGQFNQAQLSHSRFEWNTLSSAVYTLAVAVMLTGLIGLYSTVQRDDIAQQTRTLQASIDDLMLNSRGLEVMLHQVASQNAQLSSSERRIADRLYWRLSYLDEMISENTGADSSNSERIKTLWGNRIETLTDLNQLYSNEQLIDYGIPEI